MMLQISGREVADTEEGGEAEQAEGGSERVQEAMAEEEGMETKEEKKRINTVWMEEEEVWERDSHRSW